VSAYRGRARDGPQQWLAGFQGYLQADAFRGGLGPSYRGSRLQRPRVASSPAGIRSSKISAKAAWASLALIGPLTLASPWGLIGAPTIPHLSIMMDLAPRMIAKER
jgi:hypothetical protein